MLGDGADFAALADGGFVGIGLPEVLGGSGGTVADAAVVLDAAAYAFLDGPVAETGWLAGWLLTSSGAHAPTGRASAIAGDIEIDGERVSGHFRRVPQADRAEEFVILGRGFLARVARDAVQVEPGRNLAGEDRSTVTLSHAAAEILPTTITAEQFRLRGALARAIQIRGAARRALELSVRYASEREQFGRPIARFQAVQHLLAQMASETFLIESSTRAAVALVGTSGEAFASAAAKQNASEAAARIARAAHQVHGAIGTTREHDLHRATTRLWSWAEEFGGAAEWAEKINDWSTAEVDLWAGGDLTMIDGMENSPLVGRATLTEHVHRVALAMDDLDKPSIAAVNGVAVGAGMDMALMCDIRYMARRARMSEGYVTLGLVPGDGGAHYLPRIVGVAKALELLLTGDAVGADEALAIGLVSRVVDDADLLAETQAFAARLAAGPPVATRLITRAVHLSLHNDLRTNLDLISSYMGLAATSDHAREARDAWRERRPPKYHRG